MIILRPGSGLCNRLRAIGSAVRLSHDLGIGLQVEWFRCPIRRWSAMCGMRVGFSDLFEPIEGVKVREKIIVRNDLPWNYWTYSQHNARFYDEDRRKQFVEDVKRDPDLTRWLWTCFPFYAEPDFSWVRPRTKILMRIEKFAKMFGRHCIGIHIRRTDNRAAIEGSPLSLFTEKMAIEVDADENVTFFVSTDDPEVKRVLRNQFGSRVIYCEEVAPRYTRKGEEDAVIDLMLLSRTSKIYGSYWSSFSVVASQIGGIELEILVQKNVKLPEWIPA